MPTTLPDGIGAEVFTCPKSMVYGPCGGVEFDGRCEVAAHRCVFLDVETVRWNGVVRGAAPQPTPVFSNPSRGPTPGVVDPTHEPVASAGAIAMRELIAMRQIVVADFPSRALDAASIAECGGILAGSVDAVLAGDAGNARVQFPPAYRAFLLQQSGLAVWSGFTCRDRNRVAMEGELAALAHVGVAGVHCVTGDHTLTGSRPDAMPVFDLDSTQAASLARASGHLVSVGESPATPPVDRRPDRLRQKMLAGAEICFVNHAGGAAPVADFIERARELGVTMGFIPCIPIVVDRASAELLRSFTTLVLPDGYLDGILRAPNTFAAGIEAALRHAEQFLAIKGVVGVNLSGGAGVGHEAWFAEALARIGSRVLA